MVTLPDHFWLQEFIKQHKNYPSLCVKRSRAMISRNIINDYFNNLEMTFAGINPGNLINFDETNMCDDPGQEMVIHKDIKRPEIIDITKSSISIMFAIAGDEQLLAPYVVYKAKHVYNVWIEGGPERTAYNCSSSGWFNSSL